MAHGVRYIYRNMEELRRELWMFAEKGKFVRGFLLYPTETAYAIGCDATNTRVVQAIFRLKGRGRGKSLPLIVASRAMAERYAVFTPLARRLARMYWPGPLTLVLRARRRFPIGIAVADGSIALRVSAHPIARALSRQLGRPIVATSANRSGKPPCFSARAACEALFPRAVQLGVPLDTIDFGTLPRRRPSTIVDARGITPIILRSGSIPITIRIQRPR